jgi:lipoate-protein ligase A
VDTLKDALLASFAVTVGRPVARVDVRELDQHELAYERERFCSPTWLFKGERRFGESRQARFDWGSVRIDVTREDGIIRDLVVFSDGLDAELIEGISELLVGSTDSLEELVRRLRAGGFAEEAALDVARLVAG